MGCCQAVEIHHKCVDEASLEGKEIRNTIVITFAFQVVFTSFNALQNLHSSLHDEESLGNISLAILYGTAIISSIFSPTLIGLIGAKTSIVASFIAHCIYVLANFYPSFTTMAPAAVAMGAFFGPAWTSQALYISASAFSFSKSSPASPYSILSRFNGFFFAVFATAQILGNLVTSTIIRDGVSNSTDVIIKFCGPDDCPHHENATTIEDPEEWVIDITLGFLMACTLLGLFLIVFLLSPLPRSEWIQGVSVRNTATSCFSVLMSTNMMLLVPLIIFTAVEHAFLMSAYTKSYVACPIGIHMVGYVMAVYGVTTPVFVYIFSQLARITGRFLLLMLSLTTHIFLFIVLFRWTPTADDKAVIFIIPIVWGVSESILQAQANALIAMLFPSQKEPAFANFHAWRSLGYAVTFLNASYMCVSTKLIVCMTFAGLGTVLYIFLEFKSKIKQKFAFKRSRPSVVSIHSSKRQGLHLSEFLNETNRGSLQTVQDRLSFERVELTDIITEAQQGWTRDEKGLTLEITKVMSHEHLACSKATNWFHAGPALCGYIDTYESRNAGTNGLPRSISDGHLFYAAAKAEAALHRTQCEQVNTIDDDEKNQTSATAQKSCISDTMTHSIDVIPEVTFENELTAGQETETNVDQNIDNDISRNGNTDKAEGNEIIKYINLLQYPKDSLNLNERKVEVGRGESMCYDGHDNQTFESDNSDPCYDGDIVFTYGETTPSDGGVKNNAFELGEDDTKNSATVRKTEMKMDSHKSSRALRLSSNDHGYFSQNTDDTDSLYSDINNYSTDMTSMPKLTVCSNDTKKPKKRKTLNVFKAIGVFKKTNTNNNVYTDQTSPNENIQDIDIEGEKESNNSDVDSNGFADTEFEDNISYLTIDFIDMDRNKRKGLIPISETEDITCIY